MVIGITGRISSGKSTVTEFLKNSGYKIFDCDAISHELYNNPEFVQLLIDAFGDEVCTDGCFDKVKLRRKVFSDEYSRKRLNSICLLPIKAEVLKNLNSRETVFVDAPILFESELYKDIAFSEIWIVDIGILNLLKRLRGRNPELSDREIEGILSSQTTTGQKLSLAKKENIKTVVFDNNGTRSSLLKQVKEALHDRGI